MCIHFYPRPPRGGRLVLVVIIYQIVKFLSTSPAWGTTTLFICQCYHLTHFYPRPPRGGRPYHSGNPTGIMLFLSTSPAWGTTTMATGGDDVYTFLSTSPAWGTTVQIYNRTRGVIISIHVPRVGDDRLDTDRKPQPLYFYPRPPRGGRRIVSVRVRVSATISIHVPRVGDDCCFEDLARL